jgi:hypothetical protein
MARESTSESLLDIILKPLSSSVILCTFTPS